MADDHQGQLDAAKPRRHAPLGHLPACGGVPAAAETEQQRAGQSVRGGGMTREPMGWFEIGRGLCNCWICQERQRQRDIAARGDVEEMRRLMDELAAALAEAQEQLAMYRAEGAR